MRCYICDVVIEKPNFNADHNDYEPCDYCQQIVNETVGNFTEKPYADDDDFGEDILDFAVSTDWSLEQENF